MAVSIMPSQSLAFRVSEFGFRASGLGVKFASAPSRARTGANAGPMRTMVPNSMISAIHLYHCLAFPMRKDDWFHHMTSLPVLDPKPEPEPYTLNPNPIS